MSDRGTREHADARERRWTRLAVVSLGASLLVLFCIVAGLFLAAGWPR